MSKENNNLKIKQIAYSKNIQKKIKTMLSGDE